MNRDSLLESKNLLVTEVDRVESEYVAPSVRNSTLTYTAGSLDIQDIAIFQKMIFRVSKGKALVNFSDQKFETFASAKDKGDGSKNCVKRVYVVIYEAAFL